MSSEKSMYELQFKTNKKKKKNYNWEYFKSQINKKLSEPETKISTVKEKLMWNLFLDWKAILGFLGCLSEDSIQSQENLVLY